jgi:hypothetical protein
MPLPRRSWSSIPRRMLPPDDPVASGCLFSRRSNLCLAVRPTGSGAINAEHGREAVEVVAEPHHTGQFNNPRVPVPRAQALHEVRVDLVRVTRHCLGEAQGVPRFNGEPFFESPPLDRIDLCLRNADPPRRGGMAFDSVVALVETRDLQQNELLDLPRHSFTRHERRVVGDQGRQNFRSMGPDTEGVVTAGGGILDVAGGGSSASA